MAPNGFTLDSWLAMAQRSARDRQLPELEPLLAGLLPALRKVREAHSELTHVTNDAVPRSAGREKS